MSSAKQFLENINRTFPEYLKERAQNSYLYKNGSVIVFHRRLTNANIKYLFGLGYGVLLITPDKINHPHFWKRLVRTGLLMDEAVHRMIDDRRYFWVAWPSQCHIEKSEKAARAIQKWWTATKTVEDCYDEDFEEDSEVSGAYDEETSGADAAEASDEETSGGEEAAAAAEASDSAEDPPLTSRCHAETMRCRNCWKNNDDGGERKCWYENVEEQTNAQREAYRKFLSLDTLYLTSGGNVKKEREAAYKDFIQKIGGRTSERITALRVVDDIMDSIEWDSSDDGESTEDDHMGSNNQGWINTIFRSAGLQ